MSSKSFLMAALLLVGVLQLWAQPAQARHGETTDFAMAGHEEQTTFTFAVVDRQIGGPDQVILSGHGTFSSDDVEGGGSFTHFSPSGGPPFPIVASGTWEARRFVSFTPFGTYGAQESGILEMVVRFIPQGGPPVQLTMKVVCNVPAGGLFTGQAEGVTLSASGTPIFEPMGQGVTLFNPGAEEQK